mmetsp:Transcript_35612/g.33767  ORF Transcript_35612/g.33767 Transcript_35612/m.33767 type:complete len:545 (+) Transcript_35612:166-1800(+)
MNGMLMLDSFRGENRLKRGTSYSMTDTSQYSCETSEGLENEGEIIVLKGEEDVKDDMRSSSDFYEDEAQAPLALLGLKACKMIETATINNPHIGIEIKREIDSIIEHSFMNVNEDSQKSKKICPNIKSILDVSSIMEGEYMDEEGQKGNQEDKKDNYQYNFSSHYNGNNGEDDKKENSYDLNNYYDKCKYSHKNHKNYTYIEEDIHKRNNMVSKFQNKINNLHKNINDYNKNNNDDYNNDQNDIKTDKSDFYDKNEYKNYLNQLNQNRQNILSHMYTTSEQCTSRFENVPPLPLGSKLQGDPTVIKEKSDDTEDSVVKISSRSSTSTDSLQTINEASTCLDSPENVQEEGYEGEHSIGENRISPRGNRSPELVPVHGGKELLKISDEEMLNFPSKLTEAFNIGDYEGVSKMIMRCIAEDCALKTPALKNDLIGRHHIISVMFALLDDHPDAIMMWKDTKYLPNECILKSKHYFSGTKALHSTHTHLYQKDTGSLLTQIDLTKYTPEEIIQLELLEKAIVKKGSPFLIFAKGLLSISRSPPSENS